MNESMGMVYDVILAKPTDRDLVLKVLEHAQKFETLADARFSVDDVVTLLSICRAVQDDRNKWHTLRREVYASFAENPKIRKCTIALLSTEIRDEVANLEESDAAKVVDQWPEVQPHTSASLWKFILACRLACEKKWAVMIKEYDAGNEFEAAIKHLPDAEQDESRAVFRSWNAEQKLAAHVRYRFLRLLGYGDDISHQLEIVREELEHGQVHCATLGLLTALRKSAEAVIRQGIDGLDYLDQMDAETQTALAKFKAALGEQDQQRVMRAFTITLMSDLLDVVENGHAVGIPNGPTSWALVETDREGLATGEPLGELHAHFDADQTFWPAIDD